MVPFGAGQPKERPLGKSGEISHEVIAPGPVTMAFSGKSVLI